MVEREQAQKKGGSIISKQRSPPAAPVSQPAPSFLSSCSRRPPFFRAGHKGRCGQPDPCPLGRTDPGRGDQNLEDPFGRYLGPLPRFLFLPRRRKVLRKQLADLRRRAKSAENGRPRSPFTSTPPARKNSRALRPFDFGTTCSPTFRAVCSRCFLPQAARALCAPSSNGELHENKRDPNHERAPPRPSERPPAVYAAR